MVIQTGIDTLLLISYTAVIVGAGIVYLILKWLDRQEGDRKAEDKEEEDTTD